MSNGKHRRPAAFRIDEVDIAETGPPRRSARTTIIPATDPFAPPVAAEERAVVVPRRGARWLGLFAAAGGGLVLLAMGLAVDSLIRALFERTDWLGWFGLALAALAVLAVIALAVREILALLRLRRIEHIHAAASAAAEADDRQGARTASRELIALYRDRPDTARGRAALATHIDEIIDGRDLISLAETELLVGMDETARRMVLSSAKRVSVVTAVSPRALVDVLFVVAEIVRLIHRLAALYGGRPGTLGFMRLARTVLGHLAVTGGMAAGDSLVQQLVGHGIAARLSARLGEGVVNGLMTARVGIAAIDVCRPFPFVAGRPPRIGDVMAELTKVAKKAEAEPEGD
jgi:putative membrane protein